MRFLHISDTHNQIIPRYHGDCLIHSGDMTNRGTEKELIEVAEHLAGYPCRRILVVPGNHDILFETDTKRAREIFESRNITVLMGEQTEIGGVKIFGQHGNPKTWGCFGYDGYERLEPWDNIPNDTEILITHCPPKWVLDLEPFGRHLGCPELARKVNLIKPKYHLFGHIHFSAGRVESNGITYLNSAMVSEKLMPLNPPQYFNYGLPGCYERE